MDKATLISEMQKVHLRSKIFCSDGEQGMLVQVIFDPSTRHMTSIGVKLGRLFGKTVYLPFDSIVKASGDGVSLRIKRVELAAASSAPPIGALLDSKSKVVRVEAAHEGLLMIFAVRPENGELTYIVYR